MDTNKLKTLKMREEALKKELAEVQAQLKEEILLVVPDGSSLKEEGLSVYWKTSGVKSIIDIDLISKNHEVRRYNNLLKEEEYFKVNYSKKTEGVRTPICTLK